MNQEGILKNKIFMCASRSHKISFLESRFYNIFIEHLIVVLTKPVCLKGLSTKNRKGIPVKIHDVIKPQINHVPGNDRHFTFSVACTFMIHLRFSEICC